MPLSSECADALLNPVRDYERELRIVTRERDALKQRLREIHQWQCTADNCELDGGEEHEEYFKSGGKMFDERVDENEKHRTHPATPN